MCVGLFSAMQRVQAMAFQSGWEQGYKMNQPINPHRTDYAFQTHHHLKLSSFCFGRTQLEEMAPRQSVANLC